MKLTAKQSCFVAEYLVDLNATQAAIRAGYSAKTADKIGSQLLGKTRVSEAIQDAMKARGHRTEITADKVLTELAKIGFADIRKAVRWGGELPVINPDTGETLVASGIVMIPSEEIDDETAAAVSEVSQTAQGLKIKLHDKRAALVDIGRHLGMFTDKIESTVTNNNFAFTVKRAGTEG